jgi:plasmid replication initiation protein
MVTEIPNHIHEQSPLLPDRHPQQELFVCDIADAVLKDDMASMEHPFFALSKKPDIQIRIYEHNGNKLEIIPSVKGLATIYDKDILIYAISQLIAGRNQGKKLEPYITISARDLLIFTNRHTGGMQYGLLEEALTRLSGTRIKTNIRTGGEEQTDIFGLIESGTLIRDEATNRVKELRIKLSDWVFNAIDAQEVLTLHRDYFRLRKPLERRVYEIARKHCGAQLEWKIGLTLLKKKCGSNSPLKHFRYLIKDLVKHDHLPDYSVTMDSEGMICFSNRRVVEEVHEATSTIKLSPDVFHDARLCAPGWDVYYLEQRWRSWMTDGGAEPPRDANKAFLGFCRKFYQRNGAPK